MSSEYVHFYGNIALTALYLIVFFAIFQKIVTTPSCRNFFAISVASLFFLSAVAFLNQAVFSAAWREPEIESIMHLVAICPAVLFLYFRRKQAFVLGAEESLPSAAKFDKLKHEFLSVASHELRTPLSVINGFAEILVREKLGPLNDEQKRRVRKILMQGQRLNRIIDELLDLSRIRSGKIDVRTDVFDLIPVLKACLDDHHIVSEQQNIRMIDQLPDVLPDVVGDLERITQVVVNILNNALKYTDEGGTIVITARHEKDKHRILVEVSDTGIGIDQQDQPHIFEEFYRASQRHSKKYSGSGLGLAIVKQLVESQNGEVGVRSEGLGKGSAFYFTLPVSKTPKTQPSFQAKPIVS